MCMIGDDGAQFWTESRIGKARKPHKCNECRRPIAIGEGYFRQFGIQDGSSFTYETCDHCRVAQALLIRECHGFLHEMVRDDLHEHINEALPWSGMAARLYIGMRRKWKRFDGGGLLAIPTLSGA